MDNSNRAPLIALLSSLLSDLFLLLFLLPTPTPTPTPLLFHFLSISQTTISLLSQSPESHQSKRRRTSMPKTLDSFNQCFNMNPSTFEWLSSLLEPLLECRDPLNSPLNLPVQTRLGIGLFRLATASDYLEITRRFNVSQPVAKFCVNQLCRVLCTNFRFWLGFPAPNKLDSISQSFQTLTGLPNCCGVVNCTRFLILNPNGSVSNTIAAQIVSDSSSRILSIVAGFNGRKGNQLILKSSSLYHDIESNSLLNARPVDINGVSIPQYLVGETGYSVLPWLMVPFDRPVGKNSCEEKFNSALDLMMVSGFRTVDSLRKWRILREPVKVEEVKTMVAYIGACSILHNALLTRDDYSCLSDKSDEDLRFRPSHEDHVDVDVSLKDDMIEQKGFEIRSALATRARRC